MKYPQRHLIKSVDLYTQLLWHLPQLYDKSGSHQSKLLGPILPLNPINRSFKLHTRHLWFSSQGRSSVLLTYLGQLFLLLTLERWRRLGVISHTHGLAVCVATLIRMVRALCGLEHRLRCCVRRLRLWGAVGGWAAIYASTRPFLWGGEGFFYEGGGSEYESDSGVFKAHIWRLQSLKGIVCWLHAINTVTNVPRIVEYILQCACTTSILHGCLCCFSYMVSLSLLSWKIYRRINLTEWKFWL